MARKVQTEQDDDAVAVDPVEMAETPDVEVAVPLFVLAEPVPENEPTDTPLLEAPEGDVFLTYRGGADRLNDGVYIFRPGVPVIVPKGRAEALLSRFSEEFEVAAQVAAPPSVEE
jgi:hypothetical protein